MTTDSHEVFYNGLKQIREQFHSKGSISDSNAKLDEITKIIAIYLDEINRNDFKRSSSLKKLVSNYAIDNNYDIVYELKKLFKLTIKNRIFDNGNGISIFGEEPQLTIPNNDKEFAYTLIDLIVNTMDRCFSDNSDSHNFDLINEAFGHFVRDNFRNNIEDAQYMTPAEIVELMTRTAISDIEISNNSDLVIVDPACGVGSFLASFHSYFKRENGFNSVSIKLYGQDKVDRMVRLSKINMLLFNTQNHEITLGNSLIGNSILNKLNGRVDIILTNPPFNAKFRTDELSQEPKENYPLLKDIFLHGSTNIDSELLFIDRSLSLLKDGGKLLIIVPDSVISSKGITTTLRQRLIDNCDIKAIIELPSATFAQAGTRAKTSILYLQKRFTSIHPASKYTFIAKSNDVGFEVSSRKGVKVKRKSGLNDLPYIFHAYLKAKSEIGKNTELPHVILENPSCVLIKQMDLMEQNWTPNHHHARRYEAIERIKNCHAAHFRNVYLEEIAEFITQKRKREIIPEDYKCISVLHIMNYGIINYPELLNYAPKYAGIRCHPYDVLVSKINPRIPRIIVVPEYNFPLTCSSEFEILKPYKDTDSFGLAALILLPEVQSQIIHLTSGTSSSHNRIKTEDLKRIVIPYPIKDNEYYKSFKYITNRYKKITTGLNNFVVELNKAQNELVSIFNEI